MRIFLLNEIITMDRDCDRWLVEKTLNLNEWNGFVVHFFSLVFLFHSIWALLCCRHYDINNFLNGTISVRLDFKRIIFRFTNHTHIHLFIVSIMQLSFSTFYFYCSHYYFLLTLLSAIVVFWKNEVNQSN